MASFIFACQPADGRVVHNSDTRNKTVALRKYRALSSEAKHHFMYSKTFRLFDKTVTGNWENDGVTRNVRQKGNLTTAMGDSLKEDSKIKSEIAAEDQQKWMDLVYFTMYWLTEIVRINTPEGTSSSAPSTKKANTHISQYYAWIKNNLQPTMGGRPSIRASRRSFRPSKRHPTRRLSSLRGRRP
jgi:hypothetical protein